MRLGGHAAGRLGGFTPGHPPIHARGEERHRLVLSLRSRGVAPLALLTRHREDRSSLCPVDRPCAEPCHQISATSLRLASVSPSM
jgi:hypothetical protein